MKYARVDCPVLKKALETRDFPVLNMYLSGGGFSPRQTKEGHFITDVERNEEKGDLVLGMQLSIEDYLFNEEGGEAPKLWEFVNKETGNTRIEWNVLEIVEL